MIAPSHYAATKRPSRWVFRLGWVVLVAGVVGLVAAMIRSFMIEGAKPRKSTVHQIAILKPPPPPPPPKIEEKPPEMKKEEVKLPEPQKAPEPDAAKDEPPAGKDLGVDAEGGPGGDSFGLVGKKGGRDLISLGGGSGAGDRMRFAFFASRIQQHLQAQLSREDKLRSRDYRVVVKLWLAADGRVERAELVDGTGSGDVDAALRSSLAQMPALAERPPADMPQPVRIQITSRGAG